MTYKSLAEIADEMEHMATEKTMLRVSSNIHDFVTRDSRIPNRTFTEAVRHWFKERKRRWYEKQIADIEKELIHLLKAKSEYQKEMERL